MAACGRSAAAVSSTVLGSIQPSKKGKMIKDILAVVDNADLAAPFLAAATRLAEEKGAVLEIAVLTAAPMASPALAPLGGLYIPDVVLLGDDAANLAAVEAVLSSAQCEHHVYGFHDRLTWLAGDLSRSRQVADLILVGAREAWATPALHRRVLETLVRASGTPLLILPSDRALRPLRRAVLGWKASPEATRALHALVALAEPGATIDVVTVGSTLDECQRERDGHDEVKRHLARHNHHAEGHWIVNDEKIEADVLTSYAQETKADILVIGGFSHSRIREVILGSVTRDLVARTDLPTLIVG